MADITFTIGSTSIASLIAYKGYKWAENDLHSDASGRTLDGVMHIIRIGTKAQLDISCKPMSETQAKMLLALVRTDVEIPVVYPDPVNGTSSGTFYCAARNAEFLMACRTVPWWYNIKFTLTEC